jgi:1,4-alpha-glucan branching enzyme
MFMGTELGQHTEWNVDGSVDWHLAEFPERKQLLAFVAELGRFYQSYPELWQNDPDPEGFAWIDCSDRENSVLSFRRQIAGQERHLIVILNLTPVPRDGYSLGVPRAGAYRVRLDSDRSEFGGGGYTKQDVLGTESHGLHGFAQSVRLNLPPLGTLVLEPVFD